MTAFTDQLDADVTAFLNPDEFGQAVTYTPFGGSPVSTVVVTAMGEDLEEGPTSIRAAARLFVSVADVPSPAYKDTVLIDGETWTVQRVLVNDGQVAELAISRDVRPKGKR
jgi:hypothetical protein